MIKKILFSIIILGVLFTAYELLLNVFDVRSFDIINVVYPALFITFVIAILHYFILISKGYTLKSIPRFVIGKNSINNIHDITSQLKWKKIRQDGRTTVYKTTKFNFYSFGEKIYLNEKESGELEVISKSNFPLTMFDFGKNLDNINEFKRLLLK